MKKLIAMITAIIICGAAAGCGNVMHEVETDTEIDTESEETNIQTTVETSTASTTATLEYPEFIWPGFGISEVIPQPEWITNGIIEYDMTNMFSMNAAPITYTQYKEYIKLCYEAGFTDVCMNSSSGFYAFNDDGLSIFVEYREEGVLHIWIG